MALSRFVFDVNADNFRTLVLQNSDRGPVLVNYWSLMNSERWRASTR